jgi:hypothetical protein
MAFKPVLNVRQQALRADEHPVAAESDTKSLE